LSAPAHRQQTTSRNEPVEGVQNDLQRQLPNV
jgi:hypothetical protein